LASALISIQQLITQVCRAASAFNLTATGKSPKTFLQIKFGEHSLRQFKMHQSVVPSLIIAASILIGVMMGMGTYTFIYGQGFSYFSDQSSACANCHVMSDHYDAWSRSSHKAVVNCNGCHTPDNLFGKYFVKAVNGWNHAWAFTWQNYQQPFAITEMNRRVSENACENCHRPMWEASLMGARHHRSEETCTKCHGSVGHRL